MEFTVVTTSGSVAPASKSAMSALGVIPGIPKSKTTSGAVPGASSVTVPTVTVGVAPSAPVGPVVRSFMLKHEKNFIYKGLSH